jgi:hypothetical protein
MVLHASFFICFVFTAACLLYLIVYSFIRERTPDISFDRAAERVRRLTNKFLELQQAHSKEREVLCRQIAALINFIDHACSAGPPQNGEIRELMRAAYLRGLGVYWRITVLLFLLRFRPALARDCRKVTLAAMQHAEAWIAFLRLLRAQYPAEMGHLELPE